jgi:glycosyltransferase involved in cell wall biosynthesis
VLKRRIKNLENELSRQDYGNSLFVDPSKQMHVGGIFNEQSNCAEEKTSLNDGNRITVIIPTLNEEQNISSIIGELHYLGFKNILMIDGNSTDSTVEVARELGVKILQQEKKGKGEALRQAFDYEGLRDWVVMIDADGSMDPREIFHFLEHLKNGTDVVKGSRFLPYGSSEDMTFLRRIGNTFFVSLVNLIWGANYTDLCYGFAAFKKEALRTLQPYLESSAFEIETELFIKAKKFGLNITEVPSFEFSRRYGKSNLHSFRDGLLILKMIISEAFRR